MLADKILLPSDRFHPAADLYRCRHTQPNREWSLGTPMAELGNSIERPTVSTKLDLRELTETEPPTRSMHRPD